MSKTLISWTFLFCLTLSALPVRAGQSQENLMLGNLGTPPKWKGWDRMTITAPGFMSKNDRLQIPLFLMKIWANEISINDRKYTDGNITRTDGSSLLGQDGHAPAKALYSVYHDGGRTVFVSMLDTAKFCESGPSDFHSTQIHSTCPIRITVVQGLSVKSADFAEGCFLDPTFDIAPGEKRWGPDPLINTSLTRYDRQAGVIDLIAIRDNKSLPECAKRLKVPQ
ncbi:MAG: hypothetical protein DM484_05275 [Candidatus Methylumidiphilus alinenensis]|uniref:Uncharacterized protein n=1 Tax=Candidatus Methylumidiphilus alinenensis TaxID=2202197 RepID=A0A2W4RKD1_9GAMM|nr:MAG: hypothetical protein DM484_05275 [Candidatus Methylumidiphilus alinenensis]